MKTGQPSGNRVLGAEQGGKEDLFHLQLSPSLMDRVEAIAREMRLTPEEVVKLAIRHVVDVMAPDRLAEVRALMEAPVSKTPPPPLVPGRVAERIRFHTSGGTEITA